MITLTATEMSALGAEITAAFEKDKGQMWFAVGPQAIDLDGQISFDDLFKLVTIIQKYVKPEDFTTATWWQVVKMTNEAAIAAIKKSEIYTLAESLQMIDNIKRRQDEFGKMMGQE